METPAQFPDHFSQNAAEILRRQYDSTTRKINTEKREGGRNLLLAPLLLSFPVIIILFILISGSTSPVQNTMADEPPPKKEFRQTSPLRDVAKINTDTAMSYNIQKRHRPARK